MPCQEGKSLGVLEPLGYLLLVNGGFIPGLFPHFSWEVFAITWSFLIFCANTFFLIFSNMYVLDQISHHIGFVHYSFHGSFIIIYCEYLFLLFLSFFFTDICFFLDEYSKVSPQNQEEKQKMKGILLLSSIIVTSLYAFFIGDTFLSYSQSESPIFYIVVYVKMHTVRFSWVLVFCSIVVYLCLFHARFIKTLRNKLSEVSYDFLFPHILEQYRQAHEELVLLVSRVDRRISVPVGLTLLFDVLCTTFDVYTLSRCTDVPLSSQILTVLYRMSEIYGMCAVCGILKNLVSFWFSWICALCHGKSLA